MCANRRRVNNVQLRLGHINPHERWYARFGPTSRYWSRSPHWPGSSATAGTVGRSTATRASSAPPCDAAAPGDTGCGGTTDPSPMGTVLRQCPGIWAKANPEEQVRTAAPGAGQLMLSGANAGNFAAAL